MADRKKLIDLLLCVPSSEVIFGKREGKRYTTAWYIANHLISHGVTVRERGRWLSAYEYGIKLGIADKEKLEELKKDKWWKFCDGCEQQVKGFHNFCPNCGADMRGTEDGK